MPNLTIDNLFTERFGARSPYLQDDNGGSDARTRSGAHAHGLHALADICLMKQREEQVQEPQLSSHGQNSREPTFIQAREETEPFPEEVLRTLCLMRNSSADLKRLLAIPTEEERTNNELFPKNTQPSSQSSKVLKGERLDRELEKMLK